MYLVNLYMVYDWAPFCAVIGLRAVSTCSMSVRHVLSGSWIFVYVYIYDRFKVISIANYLCSPISGTYGKDDIKNNLF